MYGKKKNPITTNAFATPLALCHTGTLLYPRHHPRNAGQWDKAVCQSHLFQENNKCCVQGPRRGRGWGGFSPPTFLQE